MKIAVLTLTRDRLDYTKQCFEALRKNAGVPFDHYVLDQGSTDGTVEWLRQQADDGQLHAIFSPENVGIHRGMNTLLQATAGNHDLLVKIDNDCLLKTSRTLRVIANRVLAKPEQPRIISPLIIGLRNRPGIYKTEGKLGLTRALGGIFFPIPPLFLKEGFRYDESAPIWGGDDERLSNMTHERGGITAYLLSHEAEHIETTDGQHERYPSYFARRRSEGGPD